MKKLKSLIVLLVVTLSLTLFACSNEVEEQVSVYKISAVYDEQNHTVTAEMSLSYYNATGSVLDEVCMHLYPAFFREDARFSPVSSELLSTAYPCGKSYGGIEVSEVTLNGQKIDVVISGEDDDILVVKLGENGELYPGERVTIGVNFTLTIPQVNHRFGYNGRTVNLGNWYPVACVYEDGKFVTDTYCEYGDPFYSECANYEISLSVPSGLAVASTGETSKSEGDVCDLFELKANKVRDFAIVIGEMKMLGARVNGVDINYYYTADDNAEKTLACASDAIKTFSNLFGKYPYSTYSVVRTHFLHGGMEYPALSLISDALNDSLFTEAVIHETAHQWWYGVVGNNEVKNAWMDEGLSEFSTGLFYEQNPSYGVDANKRQADALGAYIIYFDDCKANARDDSMNRSLGEYKDTFEYTYCSYVKGELMFSSLRTVIGNDDFINGLKKYYNDYKFKNAKPDDLIGCFERTSARPLKSFFDAWTEGKVKMFA